MPSTVEIAVSLKSFSQEAKFCLSRGMISNLTKPCLSLLLVVINCDEKSSELR